MNTWREHLRHFLFNNNGLGDIYEFGVFTGNSMVELCEICRDTNTVIDTLFGLDSFEGLPAEMAEPIWQECWEKGGFNATQKLGTKSIEDTVEAVKSFVETAPEVYEKLVFVPGFYDISLTQDAVKKFNMKPALYIDMDMDIYSSAIFVLDFMFQNNLILPGTIIGYDDWGGSKGWETMSSGESRAHKEAQEKYNVEFSVLYQLGNCFPHAHKVYKVESIG